MKHFKTMKQLFLILFLSVFTFGFTNNEHPIYIGVTEIDYFPKKKEVQVSLRIFTDDLEKAIREDGKRLNLDTSTEIKDADIFIQKYLKKHFYIKINDKINPTLTYIGKEYEDNATWMYFNYTGLPKKVKSVSIKNTAIMEIYPKQKFMTNFRKDRKIVQSKNLTKKRSTMIVNLK